MICTYSLEPSSSNLPLISIAAPRHSQIVIIAAAQLGKRTRLEHHQRLPANVLHAYTTSSLLGVFAGPAAKRQRHRPALSSCIKQRTASAFERAICY